MAASDPSKTPVLAATTKAYSIIKSDSWFYFVVCGLAFGLPVIILDLVLVPAALATAQLLQTMTASSGQLGPTLDYLTLIEPMAQFAGRYLVLALFAALTAAVGYWALINRSLGLLGLRPPLTPAATCTDALWTFARYGLVFYTSLGLVLAVTGSLFILPMVIAAVMLAAPVLIVERAKTLWQSLVSAATVSYPVPSAGRKLGLIVGWLTIFVSYIFAGQMLSSLSSAASSEGATRFGLFLGLTSPQPGWFAVAGPLLVDAVVSALLALLTGFLAVATTCYLHICRTGEGLGQAADNTKRAAI